MGLTNFTHGITSFGIPVFGGGSFSVPLMGRDAKVYIVDPANGSDGNEGSWERPLDSVSAAYAKTVDKRGDVIILLNDGNTSGTSRESETLTWAKDNTHLVGFCAPTVLSQRARISPPTSQSTIVTPQLSVTGNGNIFANLSFFEGTSEDGVDSEGINVSGSRNYFYNVAMMNMGDSANGHSGDQDDSFHLHIAGGQENTFDSCYIGLDTAAKTGATDATGPANVRFTSQATRNLFRNCILPTFADNDRVTFVRASGSGDLDRWTIFDNCMFINAVASTATSMVAAIAIHATAGGHILIKDCSLVGAGDWTRVGATIADSTNVAVLCHEGDAPVTTGIMVTADVSA